jgi:hypothetical protein
LSGGWSLGRTHLIQIGHLRLHHDYVESVKLANLRSHEFDKADYFVRPRFQKQSFLMHLRVLKLNFPSILFLDENGDLSPEAVLALEGQNTSESVPDKLIIDPLGIRTFFHGSVATEEDILGHTSFIAAKLVILFPVGHVDRNVGVGYYICVHRDIISFCVDVE